MRPRVPTSSAARAAGASSVHARSACSPPGHPSSSAASASTPVAARDPTAAVLEGAPSSITAKETG